MLKAYGHGYRRRNVRGRKFRKGDGKGKGRKRPGFIPRGRGKGYSRTTEDYENPDSSLLGKGEGKKGNKSYTPQWQQPYVGKGNKGKDQQPFAGKAKGKSKKGKANMTEDPSATSTTAESASWQGDDASGVGTDDWGYYGEGWYQSGRRDSFSSYCVEHIERSDKTDRQDDISHARENATTELTVNAFSACAEGARKETKSSLTSLVSFCTQHSEQSLLSSVIDLSREPTFVILDTGRTVDGIETCREPFDAGMFETGAKPHLVQDGTLTEYVHVRRRGNVCDHSEIGHVFCPF